MLVPLEEHGFQMPNGRARAPRQGPAIGQRLEVVSVSGTCDMHARSPKQYVRISVVLVGRSMFSMLESGQRYLSRAKVV